MILEPPIYTLTDAPIPKPPLCRSVRPGTLPEPGVDNCKKLLIALDLVYGAFDFVQSPEGELFFLEVNPAGEWAWLELELDLPLRVAFIDLFHLQHQEGS